MKPDARTAREYAETVLAQLGECRNCFMPCGQCPEAARALVRGLLHEVERLEQERDEATDELAAELAEERTLHGQTIDRAEAAEARAVQAERERDEALARLERMEEALEWMDCYVVCLHDVMNKRRPVIGLPEARAGWQVARALLAAREEETT